MRAFAALLAVLCVACGEIPGRVPIVASPSAAVAVSVTASASVAPTATTRPTPTPAPTLRPIADILAQINPAKLDDHLRALTSFVSRHPLHPGHAKAVAYLMEQLSAIPG